MKNPRSVGTRIAAALTLAGLLATAGMAQERPFPLTQAVPDDVFLVTAERHNPQKDFLDAYWGEVLQAFQESGMCEDATGLLLGAMPDEHREEVTRAFDRFAGLCADVDWQALGGGDVVFAERLQAPVFLGNGAVLSQPEMLILFRPEREVAAESFAGLRAILRAAVEEVAALAGLPLEVDELDLHGTQLVSIDVLQHFENVPHMAISVGRHDDVLLVAYGRGIHEGAVELLAGKGEAESIAASPRFVQALGELPPDAEALEFFDFHNLRRGIDRFADGVFAQVEAEIQVEERMLNAVREGEVHALTREALVPYRAGRYDEALELTHEAHRLEPTDTIAMFNLACLYALKGETEKALDWLEKTVAGGCHAPTSIASDPDLASLHTEPRYAEILGKAMLAARADAFAPLASARACLEHALLPLELVDSAATGYVTKGHATYGDSITTLAEDAGRNPFRRVHAERPGMTDFLRWMPKETTSFDVSAGIDLAELAGFIEDSVAAAGDPGEEALAAWKQLQERFDFDLEKDVLGWIDGATVQTSFRLDGEDVWVWRMKVRDDAIAGEKLALLLRELPRKVSEVATEAPMLAMLTPRASPTAHAELSGFHDVAVGMMVKPLVCGVRDGWLVLGSSAEAVVLTEETAAGRHPNVAQNAELMRRAILPEGPVHSAGFADHRGGADVAAAILTGVSTFGGVAAASIPEPEAREIVTRLFGIVGKLPPVIAKIDFYEFGAHATTFDGQAWRTRSVTWYVPPERRSPPL